MGGTVMFIARLERWDRFWLLAITVPIDELAMGIGMTEITGRTSIMMFCKSLCTKCDSSTS